MITYPNLSRAGRLGNQLWQVASTIGIATAHNESFSFPEWDYQPFFNVDPDRFDGAAGTPATEYVSYMDLRAKAYLQDYALFGHIKQYIGTAFEPSPRAVEILAEIWEVEGFADLGDHVTSVHVRRGDNVTHPQGFHPLRSMDYYRDALALVPDAPIVVFSDDPAWCRANFEAATGSKVELFYEGVARPREYVDRVAYENAPVLDWIDLQLMAACDHHVISNSTYAWWGAFLSDDPEPIYPSNWFGYNVRGWTDASLMFPSAWRQVDDPTEGGI